MPLPVRFLRALALLGAGVAAAAPFSVTLSPTDAALKCSAHQTPQLTFGPPPAGTRSLALIVWDEQPNRLTGRWLVFDLPPGTRTLSPVPAASLTVSGGRAATNEAGQPGYTALCAPGRHDVYVDLYAIDEASLKLPPGTPLQQLHAQIKRHKLKEVKAHVVRTVP